MEFSLLICALTLLHLVEFALSLPQSDQVHAVSLGDAAVGLYGQSSNGRSVYAASLGGSRVGLFSRFGFPRSYATGEIFRGVIYPPPPPTRLYPVYPQVYVPDTKFYGTRTAPKIVYRPPVVKRPYRYPPFRPQPLPARVDAYASAKIESPFGSAASVSKSSADGTNAESKAISFQGQEIPSNIR